MAQVNPTNHYKWAESLGRKFHKKLPKHVPLDEIEQAARLGMLDAIKKYNNGYRVPFRTYAERRVYGEMTDYLRTTDIVRRRRKINITVIAFSALFSASYRTAFDDDYFKAFIYTKDNPYNVLEKKDTFEHIIKKFDTQTKNILRYRFVDGLSQLEIAGKIRISESRVSQILANTLRLIKQKLELNGFSKTKQIESEII